MTENLGDMLTGECQFGCPGDLETFKQIDMFGSEVVVCGECTYEFRDLGQANLGKYYKRLTGRDATSKVTGRLTLKGTTKSKGILYLKDESQEIALPLSTDRYVAWKNGPGRAFKLSQYDNGWYVGGLGVYGGRIVLPSGERMPITLSRGMSYLVEIADMSEEPVPQASVRFFHGHSAKVVE